jgi:hypothetical protein
MHKALIAQGLLTLTSPPERAETMAGDLAEEARSRGGLWFAGALAGVSLAMFFQAFGAARTRSLKLLGVGLVTWFAAYVAVRVGGTALGLQPLMIAAADVTELSVGTLLYLGGTLMLASFATGLALGRCGTAHGMSPVMPLAMFWAVAALVGFCSDIASGTPTWYCTLVYLGGLPGLYIAPLVVGGMVARRIAPPLRCGVSP